MNMGKAKTDNVPQTPKANGGNGPITFESTVAAAKLIQTQIDTKTGEIESLLVDRAKQYVSGRQVGVIGSEPDDARKWLGNVAPHLSADTLKSQAGALRTWGEPNVIAANIDYAGLVTKFAAMDKSKRGNKSPYNAVCAINTVAKRCAKEGKPLPNLLDWKVLSELVAVKEKPEEKVIEAAPKTAEQIAAEKLVTTRKAFTDMATQLLAIDSEIPAATRKHIELALKALATHLAIAA
jgi:hypothetical protein